MERLKSWLGLSTKKPVKTSIGKPDLRRLKPYGDHFDDGALQLSFTLPIALGDRAIQAAKCYCEKLGLKDVVIAHAQSMEENFTFFVAYGFSKCSIDYTTIRVSKPKFKIRNLSENDALIAKEIGRKLVVVGATTGSDAHTLGLDAIMNMKGFKGDYGLERYSQIRAYNLRSQVENEFLIRQAKRFKADVILVSQVVTQQNLHLKNLQDLVKRVKKEKDLKETMLIVGGPRMTHQVAKKFGFDAGFGSGTLPSEVASFIVDEFLRRKKS